MCKWTTLEAARFLDQHGYDCKCLRNGITWRVTDKYGKKMKFLSHELHALAEHVKETSDESHT